MSERKGGVSGEARAGDRRRRAALETAKPKAKSTRTVIDVSRETSWIAVQERDAFGHRSLERLAAGDQAGAAGALVDHRGADRLGQVELARRGAAAVDQTRTPM